MSRIGKRPVELPSGVEAKVSGQTIEVKGPKGTRSFKARLDLPRGVTVIAPSSTARVTSSVALKLRVPFGPFTSIV